MHARLVLTHAPQRGHALGSMVSALRPSGWLLIEEADPGLQPLLCPDEYGPAQERANRLRHGFRALMAERDADLAYGRTLLRRLRELGLLAVAADAYFPVSGPACTELEIATVEQIRKRLADGGVATAAESTSTWTISPPDAFPTCHLTRDHGVGPNGLSCSVLHTDLSGCVADAAVEAREWGSAVTDQIAGHYERLAATYDEHWTYDPDYIWRFAHAMTDALRLTRSDAIADIGCGTGLYTRRLCEYVEPERPILCVDPVKAMLDQLPALPGLRPMLARAEDLASGRVALPEAAPLDAIVVKESIHHMTDRRDTLEGLVQLLSPHGRILIVMLPRTIHHPLFRAAHERFQELQPDPAEIDDVLAAAGLRTSVSYRTFHVAIERERYIRMLESRYMSVLGAFSESDLQAGIDQFRQSYRDPVLRFDDHFAFLKGWVLPGWPHRGGRQAGGRQLEGALDDIARPDAGGRSIAATQPDGSGPRTDYPA